MPARLPLGPRPTPARRRAPRRWLALGLAAALAGPAARGAEAGPRLEYRGSVLLERQAEALLREGLRAPGDSAALTRGLGRVVARLQDLGYLDARAWGEWEAPRTGARAPVLRVEAEEGPRHRIVTLIFDAPARSESLQFVGALELRSGDWAGAGALGAAMERALGRMTERGHAYAQMAVTGFEWDSAGARVRLAGSLGPRVVVTDVRFEGLSATRPSVARRAVGPLVAAPFSPAKAAAGRDRLLQLGLFRDVSYEGLEGEVDRSRGRLVYRVEELRSNRFDGAMGFQGGGRPVGAARLELGNLVGTGRALGLRWESRGPARGTLAARYAEPLLLGAPMRLEVRLEQQDEETLFSRARWGGRLQFLLSGRERVEVGYERDHVLDPRGERAQSRGQSTMFAIDRDGRDRPLGPRSGSRLRIEASQAFRRETLRPTGARSARASAVEGLGEWHRGAGAKGRLGVAWEASGAARFGSDPVLGVFERYALGGAATLRGFDEQALRVDRYALSRLETRWFLGPGAQHAALFWDHAWTFARLAGPDGVRLERRRLDGIGFGLRLETQAGVLGVDYGLEPGRSPAEGKLHLQLVSSF